MSHRLALAVAVASLGWCGGANDSALREILRQGTEAVRIRQYKAAEDAYGRALRMAEAAGHKWGEAEALRGLGMIYNGRANFPEAMKVLDRAIELHRNETKDLLSLARARNNKAYTVWGLGRRDEAIRLYEEALDGFQKAGDKAETAAVLYNLVFMSPPSMRAGRLEAALGAAEELSDTRLAGKCLHLWGDTLYALGDARRAIEKLQESLKKLGAPGDRGDRARVLISLGRLYGTHRREETAIGYFEQALAIQRELGDRQGMVYSLNSIGVAEQDLGRLPAAQKCFEEALKTAKETSSPSLLAVVFGSLGRLHLRRQEHQAAEGMLRESMRLHEDRTGGKHVWLAAALIGTGQPREALDLLRQAIELAAKNGARHVHGDALYWRARALDELDEGPGAMAAIRESLAMREKLRASLIPTDYLKRGFSESHRQMFEFAVDLLFRRHQHEEALVASEQARGRAFLDLLASRSLQDAASTTAPATAVQRPGVDEPHIASLAAVPAPTLAAIRAGARGAGMLLAYRVDPKATYGWLVPEQGVIHGFRVPVTSRRLEELVGRAGGASPNGPAGVTGQLVAQIGTRGSRPMAGLPAQAAASRELYGLLIKPVAEHLAKAAGLVIIPDGPLYRLSFASLTDERNRYLIEDHPLSYAPAATVLEHVRRGGAGGAGAKPGFLLISDPRSMPAGPDGAPLPELPGARREAAAIAGSLQGGVTLLSGSDAMEAAVRERLGSHRVVHFATHGVLIDDRPFDSFLALGRGSPEAKADGRLTVREIYDLDMDADLVVLSACRTAAGPITGDGIVGLTRAFFYAGASGMIATLWDVADEPTRRLVSRFYHHYSQGKSKSHALRAAQLELLTALRKKQVSVTTPLGRIVLPEHPVFWAGFVMLGRP